MVRRICCRESVHFEVVSMLPRAEIPAHQTISFQ